MAQNGLVYIQSVDADTPLDVSSFEYSLGFGEPGTAAHVVVQKFNPDGTLGQIDSISAQPGEYEFLKAGSWARMTVNADGTSLVPLPLLSVAQQQKLLTPQQKTTVANNIAQPQFQALKSQIDAAALDGAVLAKSGKQTAASYVRPSWMPEPAPHWAYLLGEQSAADPDNPGLPEYALPESYMRIGTVAFMNAVGPLDLSVTNTNQLQITPVLRQATALKRLGGVVRKVVTFSIMFPDETAIESELIPFLRQSRRAPFMPVVHSGLLYHHNITSLAVQAVSVSTVQDVPGALLAQVVAYPFPEDRYLLDGDILDSTINYPLLTLWLASDGREKNTLDYYQTQNAPPDTPTWNGLLSIRTPSRDWLDSANENQTSDEAALNQSYQIQNSDGSTTSLLSIGAQALSDPTTAAGKTAAANALKQLPFADVDAQGDATNASPVMRIKSINGSDVVPDCVGFVVTSAIAPYAFARAESGGATFVLQNYAMSSDGVTGTPLDDDQRDRLDNPNAGTFSASNGRYLAIWQLGARHYLPLEREAQANQPNNASAIPHAAQTGQTSLTAALENAAVRQAINPFHPVFDAPTVLDEFVIESVTAGVANCLAEISPSDAETPEYQVMGSSDTAIQFVGVGTQTTVDDLAAVLHEITRLAVDYRGNATGTPAGGYCLLQNEIAKTMGISTAIPRNVSVSTIPEMPDLRRITLDFVSYDVSQRRINLPADFSQAQGSPLTQAAPTDIPASAPPPTAGTTTQNPLGTLTGAALTPISPFLAPFGNVLFPAAAATPAPTDAPFSYAAVDSFLVRAKAYEAIDKDLSTIDLYPDIQPPSWSQLQEMVLDIQGQTPDAPLDKSRPWLAEWSYGADYLALSEARAFAKQPLPYDESQGIPVGFADPDFYACGRGNPSANSGGAYIQEILQGLYDDNHTVVLAGTDGVEAAVQFGNPGLHFNPSQRGADAMNEVIKSAGQNSGGDPGSRGQALGVPKNARNSRVTKVTPVNSAAPQTGNVLAPSGGGVSNASVNDEATFNAVCAPSVKSGAWTQDDVTALKNAAIRNDVPLVIAAKLAKGETGIGINTSGTGARGMLQIEPGTYDEYFRKALDAGLPVKFPKDPSKIAQNTMVGLYYFKSLYTIGYNQINPSLNYTQGQKNLYATQYAAAAYDSGVGFSRGLAYHHLSGFKSDPANFLNNLQSVYGAIPKSSGNNIYDYVSDITNGISADSFAAGTVNADSASPSAASVAAGNLSVYQSLVPGDNISADANPPVAVTLHPSKDPSKTVKTNIPGVEIATDQSVIDAPPTFGTPHDQLTETAEQQEQAYEQTHPNRVWDSDRAVWDPVNGEDIFYSLRRSESEGRILRAFPTCLVLLVNGGKWIGYYHMTDTFYGLHASVDVQVYSSMATPADSCTISFADPYNNLSSQGQDNALAVATNTANDYSIDAVFNGFLSLFAPNADIVARRDQELKALLMKPGNRLHVRMGYGSDATALPTVFNGVCSSVAHNDEIISVVGLGDGCELLSDLPAVDGATSGTFYKNVGAFGAGQEIRDIALGILTDSSHEFLAQVTDGIFCASNPYGIEHFGDTTRVYLTTDSTDVGINIYSGWGDQPINITMAGENAGLFSLVPELADLADQGIGQGLDAIQDAFSPQGKNYIDGMGMNQLFRVLQGEVLVGLKMENATPWQVFDTLRLTCLDYVCGVEPFSLRSTLFFGKSWWPYHYQYNFDVLNAPDLRTRTASYPGAQVFSVNPDFEQFYRRRPFLQVHFCHSGYNLIASRIEASAEGWHRGVQAVGSFAGTFDVEQIETSRIQYLDTDIFHEYQNMKLVQSGLFSTPNMRTAQGFGDQNLAELGMSTNALNNYAVGVLHDEVRRMYGGDVYMTGNGWIRPRHMIFINDAMKQITGPAEVKAVSHTFSAQGGFVTVWEPSCLAHAHDTQMIQILAHAASVGTRLFLGRALSKAVRTETGSKVIRKAINLGLRATGAVDEGVGRTLGAGARWLGAHATRVGSGLFNRTPWGSKRSAFLNEYNTKTGIVESNRAVKDIIDRVFRKEGLAVRYVRDTQKGVSRERYGKILSKGRKAFVRFNEEQTGSKLDRAGIRRSNKFFEKRFRKIIKEFDNTAISGQLDRSYFKWLADFFQSGPKGVTVKAALKNLFLDGRRLRDGINRVAKPGINRDQVATFSKLIKKVDPTLHAAIQDALDAGGGDTDVAAVTSALEARVKALGEQKDAAQAKADDPAETTEARQAAQAEADSLSKTIETSAGHLEDLGKAGGVLAKGLEGTLKAAERAASLAKEAVGAARAFREGSTVFKVLDGLDPIGDAAFILLGALTTNANRYLASRQALKLMPLKICGQEFTAGINGHEGCVVGDPLGPSDKLFNRILGKGGALGLSVPATLLGFEDPQYGDD